MSEVITNNNQAQLNRVDTDPDLTTILNAFKRNILLNLNCHHIGTIETFDETNQTASVSINYTKKFSRYNAQTLVYDYIAENYPVIVQCPVIFLGGDGGALTFPIKGGEECMLLFNDRDLDIWWSGLQNSPPATPRLHSYTDAVALVGIRSTQNFIKSFDMARALLQYNGAMVGVGSQGLVLINNAQGQSLGTILKQFVTDLQTLATNLQGNPSTEPAAAAAGVALETACTTLNTLVEGLLE